MNSPDDKIFGAQPPASTPARGVGQAVCDHVPRVDCRAKRPGPGDRCLGTRPADDSLCATADLWPQDTPFLERVMGEVRSKGLEDCVRYLGPKSLEQLVPEIEACDLGIVPNHHSALRRSIHRPGYFEYLALGKPVIAPRALGITDYFDERSLLFFDLGSGEDLARKIEYACANPAEVRRNRQKRTRSLSGPLLADRAGAPGRSRRRTVVRRKRIERSTRNGITLRMVSHRDGRHRFGRS